MIDTYLNPGFPIGISALPYIGKGPHGNNIEDPSSFLDHDISSHWKKIFVENIISSGGTKHWPAFRDMLSKIYENDKSPFTMAGLFLIPHEIFTSIDSIMTFEKNEYSKINEFIKKDTTEQLEDCERLQFKKLLVSTFLETQSLSPMFLMMEQAFKKIKSSKYPNLYFEPHKLEIDKNTNNFSVEIMPMISIPSKLSTDLVSSTEQKSYHYYNSFGALFKISGKVITTNDLNREKVKIETLGVNEIISGEYFEQQKNQLPEISQILETKYDMESVRKEIISIFLNQPQEVFSEKLWFNIINVDIFNTINSVVNTNLSFNSSEEEIEKVLLSFIMQFYNKHKSLFSTKKMN